MTKRQFLTLVALSTVILCGVLYLIFFPTSIKVGTQSTGLVRVVVMDGETQRCIPSTAVTFESTYPLIDSTKNTGMNGAVNFTIDCFPLPVPYTVTATDSLGVQHTDSGTISAGHIDIDTLVFTYIH